MADERVRAALAAKVLGGCTTDFLRQEAADLEGWASEHGIKRVALAEAVRHIADQLDGPLAEAWERSVDVAVVETVKACGGGLPVIPVEKAVACKRAALRALEENTNG